MSTFKAFRCPRCRSSASVRRRRGSQLSIFGMRQTIVGTNVIYPISQLGALNLALVGEANGRFVEIEGADSDKGPSIDRLFTDAGAPGSVNSRDSPSLARASGSGPRWPTAAYVWIISRGSSSSSLPPNRDPRSGAGRSTWRTIFRSIAPCAAADSRRQWTNECAASPGDARCPPVIPPAISRNYTGSFGVRLLASKSSVSAGNFVPFYFQQTVGGSDIHGNRLLPSYDDYRFRGPHLLVLQESFEHSIFKTPVGIWLAADQGKVARQEDGLNFDNLLHSYTVGLTLRAGGFPVVVASWSTGGTEGSHFAFTISTSLLGGSPRHVAAVGPMGNSVTNYDGSITTTPQQLVYARDTSRSSRPSSRTAGPLPEPGAGDGQPSLADALRRRRPAPSSTCRA